jgi:hypothetical protein
VRGWQFMRTSTMRHNALLACRLPVGASYSVTSCGLHILMDQPTKAIPSSDGPSRHGGRWLGRSERLGLLQGAVWTVKL